MATERTCGECGATMLPADADRFACGECSSHDGRLAEIDIWIRTGETERLNRNHQWGALFALACERLLGGNMRATDAEVLHAVMRWLDAWQQDRRDQVKYWPMESPRSWALRLRVVDAVGIINSEGQRRGAENATIYDTATLPAEFREGGKNNGNPLVATYLAEGDWTFTKSQLAHFPRHATRPVPTVKVRIASKVMVAYEYKGLAAKRCERESRASDQDNEGH